MKIVIFLNCFFFFFKMGPSQILSPPLLKTEPSNKCTVAKVLGDCLAIIPFLQDMTSLMDESEYTRSALFFLSFFFLFFLEIQ